jgi:60 kDa SS-A/Ro ribonucleoprotein
MGLKFGTQVTVCVEGSRKGAVNFYYCRAGGRFRLDDRAAISTFGDAAEGCSIWARRTSARDRREGCRILLLRQPRRSTGASGFALRDAIDASQRHNGTCLGKAVEELNRKEKYDRLIVITDEQAHDTVPAPNGKGYVINVASNKNGVGYGKWTHIDGWSESVIEFIRTLEQTAWIN